MPTYEYLCAKGHHFDRFQKMSDRPVKKCPECGAPAERRVSGGQGLIFKGSGFYITDYGKDGKGPRKAPEASESGPPASGSTSSPEKAAPAATPKADASTPKPAKPAKQGDS